MAENERTHYVKVLMTGKKKWTFLEPRGGTNRLKIHAGQYTEVRANEIAVELVRDNPGVVVEAKAVPIYDN